MAAQQAGDAESSTGERRAGTGYALAEIHAIELAIAHYEAALKIEKRISTRSVRG